jgi:ribosomal protein S6--L-glutamate ligase
MRLISFDPFRSLGIPGVRYLKPELALRHREELAEADWLLFPQGWQANFLFYGLKKRIFPSLSTYHLGYDKVEMTRALWSVAERHVPQTEILPSCAESIEWVLEQFVFPLVVKEPRNSMGRGVFLLETPEQLRRFAAAHAVLYVQEYLPIDRDLRVVFVGEQVVAAYWRIAGAGRFHTNVAQGGRLAFDNIPGEALELVRRVAGELGIDHAGFDLVEVDGHFYFLEFNPLFGNEGLRELGTPLPRIIWEYLCAQSSQPPADPRRPLRKAS